MVWILTVETVCRVAKLISEDFRGGTTYIKIDDLGPIRADL